MLPKNYSCQTKYIASSKILVPLPGFDCGHGWKKQKDVGDAFKRWTLKLNIKCLRWRYYEKEEKKGERQPDERTRTRTMLPEQRYGSPSLTSFLDEDGWRQNLAPETLITRVVINSPDSEELDHEEIKTPILYLRIDEISFVTALRRKTGGFGERGIWKKYKWYSLSNWCYLQVPRKIVPHCLHFRPTTK